MKCALLAFFAWPAFAFPAAGVVVNFDFNLRLGDDSNVGAGTAGDTYLGLGAAPDLAANTLWNSVRRTGSSGAFAVSSAAGLNSNSPGGGPIRDSSGLETTVDILLSTTGSVSGTTTIGHQRSIGQQELGAAGVYEDLMSDYLRVDAPGEDANNIGTVHGTISGLAPNGLYELYFYGQGSNYTGVPEETAGWNSLFGITDAFGGSLIGTARQTSWTAPDGTLTEGIEFVKFTAMASATGEIFFLWQNVVAGPGGNVAVDLAPDVGGGSSDFGAFNGLQIRSVPEPSILLMAALGALGLLRRRH